MEAFFSQKPNFLRTLNGGGGPFPAQSQAMAPPDENARVRTSWTSPSRVALLLIALAIPLFFVRLGAAALIDPDEPYYAVPALEMLKSGTWAYTLLHGQPWFDKPILFYWAILAAFKTFGVSEGAARLASAVAGLGGAFAVAFLAPRAWRERGAHVLAAVVLMTTVEYAFLARAAVTDMMLTFFLTAGFLLAARWLESARAGWAAASGAAFGLAALTKGPVGLLIPGIALPLYALATRRRDLLRAAPIAAAAAGFIATSAPWYAYMAVRHRELLVKTFLGSENLGRFVNPEHRQFPLFYVAVFAVGMLPWSSALPAGLLRGWRALVRREEGPGTSPGPVYALAWFVAVVGLFSLSASKLMTYVLPAFPPAAFLVAAYWNETLGGRGQRTRLPRGASIVAWTGVAVAVLGAVAIVIASRREKFGIDPAVAIAAAAALVVASFASLAAARAGRRLAFAAAQAAVTLVIVLAAVVAGGGRLSSAASTKDLVARLRANGLADDVVAAYRVPDVSLDYYLGRTIARTTTDAELAAAVAAAPGRLWIMRGDDAEAAARRANVDATPVDRASRRWAVRLSPHDPAATVAER